MDTRDIKFDKTHLPCPCGSSSDAYSENLDGSGKCFSCGKFFKSNRELMETDKFTIEFVPWRGVTKDTMEKYKSITKVDHEGNPVEIGFFYKEGTYKVRSLSSKSFRSSGDMRNAHLFGKEIFGPGSGASIIITEGEMDAMSAYQMLGVPAVSVRSASSALDDCKKEWEYLNSFTRIYIAFDADDPGREAVTKVCSLFDNTKVFIVKLSPEHKDANGYLQAGVVNEFRNAWNSAKRYVPDNIISSFNEIKHALGEKPKEALCSYPYAKLQEMTYGMRGGEAILIKALEGVGKTEIIRSIEYHVLKETDYNVGIIHLEEPKHRTIKGLAGYELNVPVHLPDSNISNDEVFEAYKAVAKRDERVHIYSHFGSDDPDVVLGTIRFLVAVCGCKFIFLDHISILISGMEDDDERRKLDYISTRLKMMAEELDFCLLFISHVNDMGLTRGSRNISKVSDLVLKIDRNLVALTEEERNTTMLTVEKNRFGSTTGPAGKLIFDRFSFKIREYNEQLEGIVPEVRG